MRICDVNIRIAFTFAGTMNRALDSPSSPPSTQPTRLRQDSRYQPTCSFNPAIISRYPQETSHQIHPALIQQKSQVPLQKRFKTRDFRGTQTFAIKPHLSTPL